MKKMIALVFVGSFLMVGCGGSLADRAAAFGEKMCACKTDAECIKKLAAEGEEFAKELKSASKEDQKAAGAAAEAAMKACK